MRRIVLLGALAVVVAGTGVAAAGEEGERSPWTPQQAKQLFGRMTKREPFLGSAEARQDRRTIDRFFHAEDYAVLRGNPVLGYWDAGKFRWRGSRVAWDGVVPVGPSARPITSRAWDAAFEHVAQAQGLTVDPKAPIRIRGACIAAVMNPTVSDPNRGVLMEIRIDSPAGPFRYRFGMGKPTLEDAVGASLEWAIGFARAFGGGDLP